MTVPLKTIPYCDWIGASEVAVRPSSPANFETVTLSPVNADSSTWNVPLCNRTSLASAGTLSPTRSWMISPGTNVVADTSGWIVPSSLNTVHNDGCIFCNASRLSAALCACQTPTVAFITRIATMTNGSMNDFHSGSPSAGVCSRKLKIAETIATTIKIWTSRSSNCSAINANKEVLGGLASSFVPYSSNLVSTSKFDKPISGSTSNS
mmetsp:Transcript_32185/g.78458  ORF Transcript_32185/g.78458 Transcript_32185/m.78458 type:complete len:208 (+) Transcript_32185:3517-4140(+)